jgi:hypothetical protein
MRQYPHDLLSSADGTTVFKMNHEMRIIKQIDKTSTNSGIFIVEDQGTNAVHKQWHEPGWRYSSEREAYRLGLSFFPKLIDCGDRWLLVEYLKDYTNVRNNIFGYIPINVCRTIFSILLEMHRLGYSMLDFHPGNVMSNKIGNVKFIDFEYLYKYTDVHREFFNSPAIVGAVYFADRAGSLEWEAASPDIHQLKWDPSYMRHWYDRIGVPVDSLFYENDVTIRIRRAVYFVRCKIPRRLRTMRKKCGRWLA